MPKKFTRTIEDFVCHHCGKSVKGNGYTDHCPWCLWSRHVDVNPGDRMANCHGDMEPETVEYRTQEYLIYYTCTKCGYNYRVKAAKDDNLDELVRFSGIAA